jgi:hypothetical protein
VSTDSKSDRQQAIEERRIEDRRFLHVVLRLLLVLVGAYIAAWAILKFVVEAKPHLWIAASGVAVATLIGYGADLAALFKGCRAYVRDASTELKTLAPLFWKGWAALTTIFLVVFCFADPPGLQPIKDKPLPYYVFYGPAPARRGNQLGMFPVFYANNADKQHWKIGIEFTQSELDVSLDGLERIVKGWDACGSRDGKAVQLRILGFASSKDFENDPDTNLLNVQTANRRAWAAYCFVASKAPTQLQHEDKWASAPYARCPDRLNADKPHILVEMEPWSVDDAGFKAMSGERPVVDHPADLKSEAPEELARRVQFELISLGVCQRPEVASGSTMTATTTQPLH